MKIRVKIPDEYLRNEELKKEFVDDVLLWGMETGIDIEFYTWWYPADRTWNDRRTWAVFSVEEDYSFMFSLKWGALLHKPKEKKIAE